MERSLYSKLVNEGFSGLSAAEIETGLQFFHSTLCKLTPEQRALFWKMDPKDRLKEYAEFKNLNTNIF
jgi:hypothetical protein